MAKKTTFALVALMLFELVSLTQIPTAHAAYMPKPGDVIKVTTGRTVYYVDDSLQRIPLSADGFAVRYNNDFSLVKNLTEAEVRSFSASLILNRELSAPAGSFIIYTTDNPTIYLIENGMKRGFTSWQAFTSRGYRMSQVKWVGTYHLYATGANIN